MVFNTRYTETFNNLQGPLLTNMDMVDAAELVKEKQVLTTAIETNTIINDPDMKLGKIIFIAQPIALENILDFLIPDSIIPTITLTNILPSSNIKSIDTPFEVYNVINARLKSTEEALYGMAQQQHLSHHSSKYNNIYLSNSLNSNLDNWAENINVWGGSTSIPAKNKVITNHYLYKFDENNWTVGGAHINFLGVGFNAMLYIGNLESNDISDALSSASASSGVPNVLEGLIKKYSANGKYVNWKKIESEQKNIKKLKGWEWLFGWNKGKITTETTKETAQKSGAGEQQIMRIINYDNDLGPTKTDTNETAAFQNGYNKALNYVGCYKDTPNRALPNQGNNGTIDDCVEQALNESSNVIGIQFGGSSGNLPQCFHDQNPDPNLTSVKQYGEGTTLLSNTMSSNVQPKLHTCIIDPATHNSLYGGSWVNAVYTVQNTTNYKSKIKIVSLEDAKSSTYISKNIKAGSLILEISEYSSNTPLDNSPIILNAPTALNVNIEKLLIAFNPSTSNSLTEINSENTIPNLLNQVDKALNHLHTETILYSSDYLFKLELNGTSLPGIQINLNTNLDINGTPDNVEAGRYSFDDLQMFLEMTQYYNQDVSFRKIYKLDINVNNSTLGNIGFIHYDPNFIFKGTIENPYLVSLYNPDDLSGEIDGQFEFLKLQGSLSSSDSTSGPVKKYPVNNINDCISKCYNNSNCQAWEYDTKAAAATAAPSLGNCFLYENSGAIALKDILKKTAWSSASNDMKHFNIRVPNINSSARNRSCPSISTKNMIIADISRPVPGYPSLLMSNQILPDFSTVDNSFYYKIGKPMDANTLCNVQEQIKGDLTEGFLGLKEGLLSMNETWSSNDQDIFKADVNIRNKFKDMLDVSMNKTKNINNELINQQQLLNTKTNRYNTIKQELDIENNFSDASMTLNASVKDSLLKLTNHNYEYILWTILAIFIVIVALKIARK